MVTFAYLIEPPFNDRDETGALIGCDVELARTVLAVVGVPFEPVEATFAALIPGLATGRWRMTTGLFRTEERSRVALFSRPIWALPDGLLVRRGNGLGLTGYRAVARSAACVLSVVRDQIQHQTALQAGVPEGRILVFETYADAAQAVLDGRADASASVAQAHGGFLARHALARHADVPLEVVTVGAAEQAPAFGCFAFGRADESLRDAVDAALAPYLGSEAHRAMMTRYGFADAEVDLVAPPR